jgi:hypothetical protein
MSSDLAWLYIKILEMKWSIAITYYRREHLEIWTRPPNDYVEPEMEIIAYPTNVIYYDRWQIWA